MATNRYTQLTPASFNPLSIEETMMVPLAKQQRHDQTQLMAMQEGMFNNPFLDVDRELVEQGANEIKQGLAGIEEELATKGVSRGIVRKMLDLRRKKAEFLSPSGIGGKAAANYAGYQQNIKDIQANKKMNPMDQQQAMWYAGKQYSDTGGVANNASYNPYTGFESRDLSKDLMDAGAKLKPFIQKTTGWSQSADGTYWQKGTQKTTTLPPEVIQQALAAYASTNPDIVNYLKEKARITPGFDPASTLINTIQGVTPLFVRDDLERDSSRQAIPKHILGGQSSSSPGYNLELESTDNPMKDLLVPVNADGDMMNEVIGAAQGSWQGKLLSKGLEALNESSFRNKKAQLKYAKDLFDDSDFSFTNKEDREKWNKWVKENGNIVGDQSITIATPGEQSVEGFAEGVGSDYNNFMKWTQKRVFEPGVAFMNEGSLKTSSQQLLKSTGYDNMLDLAKNIQGGGVVTNWDNSLHHNLADNEKQWIKDFETPVVFNLLLPDGKNTTRVYMTRPEGGKGRNSEEKRVINELQPIISKIKQYPGEKEVDFEVPGYGKTKLKYGYWENEGQKTQKPFYQLEIDGEWIPVSLDKLSDYTYDRIYSK